MTNLKNEETSKILNAEVIDHNNNDKDSLKNEIKQLKDEINELNDKHNNINRSENVYLIVMGIMLSLMVINPSSLFRIK